MKTCTKCNILKSLEEFSRSKSGKGGCKSCCKICINKINKAWYEVNKEQAKTVARRWQYGNHKRVRENRQTWDSSNRDKNNAYGAKRRAAKLKRTPSWLTTEDWNKINAFYTEAQRLSTETGTKHHVDHIIPLQGKTVSGFHHPDNLQILTASENCSKGNTF